MDVSVEDLFLADDLEAVGGGDMADWVRTASDPISPPCVLDPWLRLGVGSRKDPLDKTGSSHSAQPRFM
jgi:hypothetical protein